MSTLLSPVTFTSCVFIPINEKTRVLEFCGTLREKLPLASVKAPRVVPGTVTDTPGIGPSPSTAEVTVPVTVLVCAISAVTPVHRNNTNNRISFFIRSSFRFKIEQVR